MTSLQFYKYQGTGNDFILMDNRAGNIRLSQQAIAQLCHRRLGIGADGLMLLEAKPGFDFYMRYFNSDGAESSMCGNGGRCITAFARKLGIVGATASFYAIDGPHKATLLQDGRISLSMQDVKEILSETDCVILDTGSPHYVQWVQEVTGIDVVQAGRAIRQLPRFAPGGINVNFVRKTAQGLTMRTYERGVEAETLSCGTGATAAAIAASNGQTGHFKTLVETPGGLLEVSFRKPGSDTATDIWLTGPAELVFEGTYSLANGF